jgi:hypothetical protein
MRQGALPALARTAVGVKKSDVRGGEPDIAYNKLGQKEGVLTEEPHSQTPVIIMIACSPWLSRQSGEFHGEFQANFQNIPQEYRFFRSAGGPRLTCPEPKGSHSKYIAALVSK